MNKIITVTTTVLGLSRSTEVRQWQRDRNYQKS